MHSQSDPWTAIRGLVHCGEPLHLVSGAELLLLDCSDGLLPELLKLALENLLQPSDSTSGNRLARMIRLARSTIQRRRCDLGESLGVSASGEMQRIRAVA